MKLHVNLATRPYVELRPFFLRLRVLMAVLAVVALALGIAGHVLGKKLRQEQAQMDLLRNRTIAAQEEKLHGEARMRQPGNAAVLDRAHFLNMRFLAKSFSWTAVMMDLENVLPVGVQVTSIEPQVTTEGDVVIRLRVSSTDRNLAVLLVRNLERSRRFLHPRLSGESTQGKEAQGATVNGSSTTAGATEFELLADYNPLPANESYEYGKEHAAKVAASGGVVKSAAGKTPAAGRTVARTAAGKKYPVNGVVLKPYVPPARPEAATTPQGGVR